MLTQSRQLLPLTSVRGMAALWVYVYHCQFLKVETPFFSKLVSSGYMGVDIFFILSGFIISYVHLPDFLSVSKLKENWKRFILLRLARIYPLHLVTLCAVFVLHETGIFGPSEHDTTARFIANVFLLQSLGIFKVMSWNVVAWSISVEWILYLCFPLFALCVATKARGPVANLFIIACCLGLWLEYFHVTNVNLSYMHEPGRSIIRGMLDFSIGVALYNLFRIRFLSKLPWDAIAYLALSGFVVAIWQRSEKVEFNDIVFTSLSALLVYSLANIRSYGNAVFSAKPLVYLGTISYSFYMWHWIFILCVCFHGMQWFPEKSFLNLSFFIMTCFMVLLAGLSYELIESPARRWIRQNIIKK
jgi:peptidoglycan/LPS O-acetylase OafA/YrhL